MRGGRVLKKFRRSETRGRIAKASLGRLIELGAKAKRPNGLPNAVLLFDLDKDGLHASLNQALQYANTVDTCRDMALRGLEVSFELWEMRLSATGLTDLAKACLEVARQSHSQIYEAKLENILSAAALRSGDLRLAIHYAESSLAIFISCGAVTHTVAAEGNLANALMKAGRADEAAQRLEDLIKWLPDGEQELLIGKIWQSLSLAYKAMENWSLAQRYATLARDWAERQGNLLELSNSLGHLGVLARREGELEIAESFQRERLTIAQKLRHERGQRNSRSQLAHICEERGDIAGAIQQHREVLELSRKLGDRHGEAADLINLGCVHINNAEPELALALLEEASALSTSLGDELRGAIADENLMEALFQTGDNAGAVNAAKRAGVVYRRKHDSSRWQRLKDAFDLWREQLANAGEKIVWPL